MSFAQNVARTSYNSLSEENTAAGRQAGTYPMPPATPHTVANVPHFDRWGVILAGGDGTRLRPLTQIICGDDRPKQFCPLTGDDTLFDQTRKRAESMIPIEHLLIPVTENHKTHYVAERGLLPSQRIVQPVNKGTAPPIVYCMLSIEQQDPNAIVAVLPCDHYYSDERAFCVALERAFEVAAQRNDSVVLLGASPHGPEVEFGWIEPGLCVEADSHELFQVQGFHEKPSLQTALRLYARGALWNTFVMVGHVRAFLAMIEAALPQMLALFDQTPLWRAREIHLDAALYDRILPADFSHDVLAAQSSHLVVLRTDDTGWSDLGRPERVMSVLRTARQRPWWIGSPSPHSLVEEEVLHAV